jgi:hypothetical protein
MEYHGQLESASKPNTAEVSIYPDEKTLMRRVDWKYEIVSLLKAEMFN